MLACAPLTSLLCFLLPSYPTHSSGSLLILQEVSDPLAARHGVFHVVAQMYDAGRLANAGMCPSDQPALFSFALLPHTFIWMPPDSAARE